jgi:hypothetical protein
MPLRNDSTTAPSSSIFSSFSGMSLRISLALAGGGQR